MGEDDDPTRIIAYNVLCLALVWCIIFLGTAYGIEWTGKVPYITMGVPFFLTVILLIRAVTLEGAGDGVSAYIGGWELHVLVRQPAVWSTAVSQIFFSLGVTFGMFTAFGSICPRQSPAFENSIMIALFNSIFSITSGFSIFGALGYLAHQQNKTIDEIVVGGPALIFGAYPDVLETLPGGIFWVRLFFFDMFLLGIDSALAIVEAIVKVIKDMFRFQDTRNVSAGVCCVGFFCGLIYSTDAGLLFLDVVDSYVNFIMIFIGMMECVVVGWFFGLERQFKTLGHNSVYIYMTTSFSSTLLASFCWFGTDSFASGICSSVIVFISIYAAGLVVAVQSSTLANKLTRDDKTRTCSDGEIFHHSQPQRWTAWDIARELVLRNVLEMKAELELSVLFMPLLVPVLIKHFIPQILWVLFVNLAVAKDSQGNSLLGNYGGYPTWPFQVLGVSIVCLSVAIIFLGFLYPKTFQCLATPPKEKTTMDKEGDTIVAVELSENVGMATDR